VKGPGEMDAQPSAAQSVEKDARLKNYTLAKQEVARLIRAAKQLLEGLGAENEVEQCQALLVKLAEDRFNLAVVGQLSEDLHSYALKRDALRRGLLNATEESAWRRVLVELTGERAVLGPWSDEAGV
jgi:hypothetical protein